jgi:transcriptional regulator with XRE-family HTH domain
MTPHELIDFRKRTGWSQQQLANHLHLSKSRIQDYERGWTRGSPPRRAAIPYLIDLACETLERRHPGGLQAQDAEQRSAARIIYYDMTGGAAEPWMRVVAQPKQPTEERVPPAIGPMDDKRGGTITSRDLQSAGLRAAIRDLDAFAWRYKTAVGDDSGELVRELRRRLLVRLPQQVDVEAIRRGNRPKLVKSEPEDGA